MLSVPDPLRILILLPGIILGLTVHEFAHGWTADRLGDPTARYAGRLTFNPLAHIDPIGLLALILAGFGWAKPVPVNPYRLRGNVRQGMVLVSLAGPAANLLLAFACALFLAGGLGHLVPYGRQLLDAAVWINIVLAVFNLLPVPPLDGAKVLAGILPGSQEWLYQMERYGTLILLVLLFTGIIGRLLMVVIRPLYGLIMTLAHGIV